MNGTTGTSGEGFQSERLQKVIADDLAEDAPLLTLPQIDQAAEVAGRAAWRWFVSMSLRTKPDFVEAMIAADTFDWEHAQPVDLQEYLTEARQRRSERRS